MFSFFTISALLYTDSYCMRSSSMGGAVAVHVAQKRAIPSFAGLVVIDVVEGEYSLYPYARLFTYVIYM